MGLFRSRRTEQKPPPPLILPAERRVDDEVHEIFGAPAAVATRGLRHAFELQNQHAESAAKYIEKRGDTVMEEAKKFRETCYRVADGIRDVAHQQECQNASISTR